MIDRTNLTLLAATAVACASLAGGVAHAGAPVGSGPVLVDPSTTQSYIAMGQVRLTGLAAGDGGTVEVIEGTSRNAVVEVGVPSRFAGTEANPRAAELNLDNGNSRLNGVGDASVKSGDCVGQWNINGTANSFSWSWSQQSDTLSLTIIRGSGGDAFNCTLTYPGFGAGLLAAHPNWDGTQSLSVAARLAMMNAARLVVVAPTGQSTTIGSLQIDGTSVTPATIGPVSGATVDKQLSSYDFDVGGQFMISGTIASSTVATGCGGESTPACMLQISIGHLSFPPVDAGGTTVVTGTEGAQVEASGSFTDPEGDPLAITQTSGPGTLVDNGDGTWTWGWTPGEDASGNIMVNANDGWGNNVTHEFSYAIENVAPSITSLTPAPSPALVGDAVTWTGAATDPAGINDPLTWSFGGTDFQQQSSVTRTYSTCGTKALTAIAKDDEGAESRPVTASVLVDGVAIGPPLEPGAQNLVQRGQVVPVKLWVGCDGSHHVGLEPAIRLRTIDTLGIPDSAIDTSIPLSASAADTTGVMRQVDGYYLYNLQVPNNPAWPAGKELTVEVYPFGTSNASVVQVVLKLRR